MNIAYANKRTFLTRFDPRMLLLWYLFFATMPWFIYNRTVLVLLFLTMLVLAAVSRVSGLIIALMAFSTFCNLIYLVVLALVIGGDLEAFASMLTLTFKLLAVALVSVAVFASLDPEKFSDALLSLKVPGQVCFGISYGYRMIPILVEQYQQIISSYRLRGRMPTGGRWLRSRKLFYLGRIAVLAFYPMLLGTAKRTRTTVEALEIKGFTYALHNPEAKRLKLSYLRLTYRDALFVAGTALYLTIIFAIGRMFPI
jgi:energy-coupling factor transport system permease protein